jgi:hypothetical protein
MNQWQSEKEHGEHLLRTGIIATMTILLGAAVLVLAITNEAPDLRARLEGALALLFPATLDSLRVAKKQHTARAPCIHDRDTDPSLSVPE